MPPATNPLSALPDAEAMSAARAIVEARRGPMPPALPVPYRPSSKEQVTAWMQRDSARDAYEREVRAEFRRLKADAALAEVSELAPGRIAA